MGLEKECRSPVSRILSLPHGGNVRSFILPHDVRNLPCGMVRLIPGDSERAGNPSPVLSCATRGFHCLLGYPWSGGLLPHLFTLTLSRVGDPGRYVFCCTVRPNGLNRSSLVIHKARCPEASGLSSMTLTRHSDRPGSGEMNIILIAQMPNMKYGNIPIAPYSHLDFAILNLEILTCHISLIPMRIFLLLL